MNLDQVTLETKFLIHTKLNRGTPSLKIRSNTSFHRQIKHISGNTADPHPHILFGIPMKSFKLCYSSR